MRKKNSFSREKLWATQFFAASLFTAQKPASFSLLVSPVAKYPDFWFYILKCSHKARMYFQHVTADEPRNKTVLQKTKPISQQLKVRTSFTTRTRGKEQRKTTWNILSMRWAVWGDGHEWKQSAVTQEAHGVLGEGEALCPAPLLTPKGTKGKTQSSQQTKSYPSCLV